MSPPADPAAKAPASFAKARLTPEEAERLAASFRPSWELDEAPFTGPGTLSAEDVRDLQAGGTHADVRPSGSIAYATNGSHAPPAPTHVSDEPENSVILDRSIAVEPPPPAAASAPPPPAQAGPAPSSRPQYAGPTGTVLIPPEAAPKPPQQAHVPPSARRQAVPALTAPAARARAASVDFEEMFPRKSKKGLWLGVGVVALGAAGFAVWAASSGGTQSAPAAPVQLAPKTDDKISAVPPPPPETAVTPPPAPPPPPPPPVTVAAQAPSPPAQAVVTQPATPPPPPPQPAAHVAAAPKAAATPAPRPAPRPKAGGGNQTIVRDVPF